MILIFLVVAYTRNYTTDFETSVYTGTGKNICVVGGWTKPNYFPKIYTILYNCIIQINIKCNIEMRNASGIYLFIAFPFTVDARLINWQDS